MYDMHCHLLPLVDDGPRTWEEAVEMARLAAAEGTTHLAVTPHFREGVWENTRERVLAGVATLRERLREASIRLQLLPGCEAALSPGLPQLVEAGQVLTLNDAGRHLLVELPYDAIPPYADAVLFQLQVRQVTPVIAHPERNRELARNPARLRAWVARGMLAQVTAGSLTGDFGAPLQAVATAFVRDGLAHCLGSDAHSAASRAPRIAGATDRLARLVGPERARSLTQEVPAAIWRGEAIRVEPAATIRHGSRRAARPSWAERLRALF